MFFHALSQQWTVILAMAWPKTDSCALSMLCNSTWKDLCHGGRTNASSLSLSNQDIHQILFRQQSPVGSAKPLWNVMHNHLLHSSSSIGLRSLAFHRQASMEQILRAGSWQCHNTFTDFYLKDLSLYSSDPIHLGPIVGAETTLPPTSH